MVSVIPGTAVRHGRNAHLLSNREKTALVDALRDQYGLAELLERLELARSSYFYHRSPLRIADKYAEVRRTLAEIFEGNCSRPNAPAPLDGCLTT